MWQSVVGRLCLTFAAFSDRIDCRMKGIAERLKESRRSAGMTQADLDLEAGLSKGHVSKIERGERVDLAPSTAMALADALDVDVRWLVFGA